MVDRPYRHLNADFLQHTLKNLAQGARTGSRFLGNNQLELQRHAILGADTVAGPAGLLEQGLRPIGVPLRDRMTRAGHWHCFREQIDCRVGISVQQRLRHDFAIDGDADRLADSRIVQNLAVGIVSQKERPGAR